ncbi:sensor histidine kinase [Arcticibacterium luteifluviistationis]|uniref:Sensor histidine kinase n=2 Tax=Arcticibacterium luteifluviistationis TaxID=1784714 RepID=A0A2Z4GCE5_9BACT|nr:sensor histidine kinase [Arcticibacterium luteifluviistationis]
MAAVIQINAKDYAEIDSLLRPIRRDEAAMDKFILEAKKVNYYEGLTYAFIQEGLAHRNVSEYPEALESLNLAIEYAERCENVDFTVIALNMMGVVHRRMEEVREALDYHKQALELAETKGSATKTGMRNIAVARNSIGNIYISLRQPELAEKEFVESMKIEKKTSNDLGLAINYQNLGSIYEERGSLDSALLFYRTSRDYNIKINSKLGKVICNNSIGQVFIKQKRFKEALGIIKPTIKDAEEIGDQYYVAMANLNYGWALLEEGNIEESRKFVMRALGQSKERNMGYFEAESYRVLAEISEKRGDYKEALNYSKKHSESEEKYLNEANQQYVADLILKYDSERKKNQIGILEKENEIANLKLADNQKIFIIAAICLSVLAGIFFFVYRQNRLRREKEFLALEQKMMRSQMNPHFIFNSLNSIKLYIINNEKDKAVYYLNKFSKLIRTILATSKEKDITLQEELDTMELYLNIENIRFSNKIKFEMKVEDGIETTGIRVPSLILQPFIENSIWHGLSSKEGLKIIKMKVSRYSNKEFLIEIEDNGIGREKSKEIKANKTLNNKSIGLDLTKQRLDNYFKDSEKEHSLEIVDLSDIKGEACGTKIVLKMPLKVKSA